jgi:hypothetical protein
MTVSYKEGEKFGIRIAFSLHQFRCPVAQVVEQQA